VNRPSGTMISPEDERRISELVDANRILADQAVLDGFGHVSVRCGGNPHGSFWSRCGSDRT
jgi:hypothetical protein